MPDAVSALAASSLNDQLRAALQKYWGFDTLRPLQREAIQATLDGRDSLVILPTGGGKSLCYQIPPLLTGRLCVVISPLIALMKDQVDGLTVAGYPAAAIHSGVSADQIADIRRRVTTGEVKLLLVAPERLLAEGGSFLSFLVRVGVGAFAIDEAHCISQWGHDFRPEYRRLAELRDTFPGVPMHAYTATATPRVRDDIVAQLGLHNPLLLTGRFDRPNLTYRVLPRISGDQQIEEVLRRHVGPGKGADSGAAIVYCISRKETERIADVLSRRAIPARAYHAGLTPHTRHQVQDDFAAERLNVVVATVAFGMGIDRSDVRCVIHASMPKSVEHYQQETGRAGRDGLPSECVLLYSSADAARWKQLMDRSAAEADPPPSPESIAAQLELLQHMSRLCNSARCRHRALSEYFGQDYQPPTTAQDAPIAERPDDPGSPPVSSRPPVPLRSSASCSACDFCLNELEPVPDASTIARKIVSCVARLTTQSPEGPRGFGVSYIADVLRGSRSEKIAQRSHDKLTTFGLLAAIDKDDLVSLTNQLVDDGALARAGTEFPTVIPGPAARSLLRSERDVALYRPRNIDRPGAADSSRPRRGYTADGQAARELSAPERALFDALRDLRRRVAAELGVPPYVVFGDATLEELCRVRPASLTSFVNVRGVGQSKLAQFGERFIAAIAAHCAASGLTLDAEQGSRPRSTSSPAPKKARAGTSSDPDRPLSTLTESRQTAYTMFERGSSIEDVAAAVQRTQRTVAQYLAEYIQRAKPVSVSAWVDDARYRRIAHAAQSASSSRLRPIYESLGGTDDGPGDATYEQIRIVINHMHALGKAPQPDPTTA